MSKNPTGPPLWGWDDFMRFVAELKEATGSRHSPTLGEIFEDAAERETTAVQDLAMVDLRMEWAQRGARSTARYLLEGEARPNHLALPLWWILQRDRWEELRYDWPRPAIDVRGVGVLAAPVLGARKRANRIKTFRETADGMGRVAAALEERAAGIRAGEIDA